MNLTSINVRMIHTNGSKLAAVASITIDDCFVIHDIKILKGNEGDFFVAMPSRKTKEGSYKDVAHPINNETRAYVHSYILNAFKEALENEPPIEEIAASEEPVQKEEI